MTTRSLKEVADDIQQWVPTNEMLRYLGVPLTYGEWQQVVAALRSTPPEERANDPAKALAAKLNEGDAARIDWMQNHNISPFWNGDGWGCSAFQGTHRTFREAVDAVMSPQREPGQA